MSRFIERVKRLEQRRKATGQVHIVMAWGDDDIVTDEHGNRMTAADFRRAHPDSKVIHMTWGDDDPQEGM